MKKQETRNQAESKLEDATKTAPTEPSPTVKEVGDKQAPKTLADEPSPKDATVQIQNIKTVFASVYTDILPNEFTVKTGIPVHLEVEVKEDGKGCMSTFMIPGIIDEPSYLAKGETLKYDFVPEKGTYQLTCAMGVLRGKLIVI